MGAMGMGLLSCECKSRGNVYGVVTISSPSSGVDLRNASLDRHPQQVHVAIDRHKYGEWEFPVAIKAPESVEFTRHGV